MMKARAARKGVSGMSPAPKTEEGMMADETTVVEQPTLGVKEFGEVKIFEFAGKTKGKGSRDIKYWKFDESKPETLPKDSAQFRQASSFTNTDAANPNGKEFTAEDMLRFLIGGFNDWSYNRAADEIGEYIPDYWPEDIQLNFRLAVRNTAKMTGMTIEDTANFLKGKVEEAYQKMKASQPVVQPVTA